MSLSTLPIPSTSPTGPAVVSASELSPSNGAAASAASAASAPVAHPVTDAAASIAPNGNLLDLFSPAMQQQLLGAFASLGGASASNGVATPAQLAALQAALVAFQAANGPGAVTAVPATLGCSEPAAPSTASSPLIGSAHQQPVSWDPTAAGTAASSMTSPPGAATVFSLAALPSVSSVPSLGPPAAGTQNAVNYATMQPTATAALVTQPSVQNGSTDSAGTSSRGSTVLAPQPPSLQLHSPAAAPVSAAAMAALNSLQLLTQPTAGVFAAPVAPQQQQLMAAQLGYAPTALAPVAAPAVPAYAPRAEFQSTGAAGPEALSIEAESVQLRNVYVASLPRTLTQAQLLAMFRPYGRVQSVRLCRGASSNDRSGYAFVLFETREAALSAVAALQRATIDGRTIQVRSAKMTENTSHLQRHPGSDALGIEAATIARTRGGPRRPTATTTTSAGPLPQQLSAAAVVPAAIPAALPMVQPAYAAYQPALQAPQPQPGMFTLVADGSAYTAMVPQPMAPQLQQQQPVYLMPQPGLGVGQLHQHPFPVAQYSVVQMMPPPHQQPTYGSFAPLYQTQPQPQ